MEHAHTCRPLPRLIVVAACTVLLSPLVPIHSQMQILLGLHDRLKSLTYDLGKLFCHLLDNRLHCPHQSHGVGKIGHASPLPKGNHR